MQTYHDWLENNHPEMLDEGWMRNLGTAAALGGAGLLGAVGYNALKSQPQALVAPMDKQIPTRQGTVPETGPESLQTPEQRADAWKQRMTKKLAAQQQGTNKQIPNRSGTLPDE